MTIRARAVVEDGKEPLRRSYPESPQPAPPPDAHEVAVLPLVMSRETLVRLQEMASAQKVPVGELLLHALESYLQNHTAKGG